MKDLKEKFVSNGYVVYRFGENIYTIHKKDEVIADNVIANPDVRVEFKANSNSDWHDDGDFFGSYDSDIIYRLNLNGGYCEATKDNYDALVECGYIFDISYKHGFKWVKITNKIIYYTNDYKPLKGEQFYFQDGKPTWIKPEPTNVAKDIYNEVQKHQNYKIVTDFTNTYCVASELHYEKLSKWLDNGGGVNLEHYSLLVVYTSKQNDNELRFTSSNFSNGKQQIKYNEQINEWVYVEEEKDDRSKFSSESHSRHTAMVSDTKDNSRVEETLKDHFAKFGFEVPEFEAEIWKEGVVTDIQKAFIGRIFEYGCDNLVYWNFDGRCHQGNGSFIDEWNLTPLKKEWYDKIIDWSIGVPIVSTDTEAIVCVGYHRYKNEIEDKNGNVVIHDITCSEWRPATKQELLSLHKATQDTEIKRGE